jgi:putative ABC transport system substrate-binding protein
MRRIGVLMNRTTDDPDGRVEVAALVGWLQERGWTPGANLQIDYRWSGGSAERARALAAELVALAPAVIMTIGASHVAAIQQVSRTVPIVFIGVTDPVGGGLVASMARPGGNATGIILAEFGTSAKWLELLKQISPQITRAAVIIDPSNPTGTGQFGSIQSVAPSMRVVLTPVDVRNAGELDRGISEFAGTPNGGLIVVANPLALVHRDAIIGLAARFRLPAVYFARSSWRAAAWFPTALTSRLNTAKPLAISTASSRARAPPTFQCRRRPSTSWSSTSKPRRRSAST